jgi:hypothetical protein
MAGTIDGRGEFCNAWLGTFEHRADRGGNSRRPGRIDFLFGGELAMSLGQVVKRPAFMFSAGLVVALLLEFIVLEGTLGISWPKDRYSAVSRLEVNVKGTDIHYITQNKRFTVVNNFLTEHGSRREELILRESFYTDLEDGAEGPPEATVAVEAVNGNNVRWSFREPGERGDAVTDEVYMVTNDGGGEIGNTYTYFSLANGTKLRTDRYSQLSTNELEDLDRSVLK